MQNSVHQLRKENKLSEAWKMAMTLHKNQPGNRRCQLELAWVYYDFLKQQVANKNYRNFIKVCNQLTSIEIEENDSILREQITWIFFKMLQNMINEKPVPFEMISEMTRAMVNIRGLLSPSLPLSVFLKTLLKIKITDNRFWLLMPWLDGNMLRKEDYEPEFYNDKKIMPLSERIFYAYAKSLIDQTKSGSQEAQHALHSLVEKSDEYPYLKNYKLTGFYLAQACFLTGYPSEAHDYAMKFVTENHNKSWAWTMLADVSPGNNHKFCFLAKAIQLEQKETFLLKAREKFIPELLSRGQQLAAKQNINIILKTRKNNNWPVPDRIKKYLNEEWFENPADSQNIEKIVIKEAEKAMEIIFANAIKTKAVVTFHQGKNLFLFTLEGNEIKHRSSLNYKPGTWLELTLYNKKIISHSLIQMPETLNENFRNFRGLLKRKSGFGFVNNIFVAPRLMGKLGENNEIICKGLAVFAHNRKKGDKSWKAITACMENE